MKSQLPLLPGETPMPRAPQVQLDDGTNCIPQHYLSYHHTIESVETIVADISYDSCYLLFVDEDNGGIFIQVGIIGVDNYLSKAELSKAKQGCKKIVYGRRWRVEPQLPSSEIIQTAYLALLKAREHEVRELVKYNEEDKTTTPFSCHHDLPLMAMSRNTNTDDDDIALPISRLQQVIAKLEYDGGKFALSNLLPLANGQQLIVLDYVKSDSTQLPELLTLQQLNVITESASENAFLFSFIDALLHLSQRHVEEHFEFKGFARFSRHNSVKKISQLSARTRHKGLTEDDKEFAQAFKQNNYETDESRVPKFPKSRLGDKLRSQMQAFDIASGILPRIENKNRA
ncbi:hypothetical protein ISG33_03955 [Glaciecola sp. MH2013]|uniref:hypothetical protein n=1 Tax=Glaciecola sp. MH2013 TaxID=2785524 RepID=UPI0018A0BF27|nr:hypothetical protein [Glaciecola sp. MH2013]MBF7072551.1 hypothetical protein [Glaciecola sp. MH2013]